MYGKIFEQIYDGSLRLNWMALVTFQQMIVLCDSHGVIDMTPESIHFRTGIPLDIILEGIKELEAPDKRSRSPEHDGRRIIRLDDHRDWGWKLVNHIYYRNLASEEDKREQARLRKQRQRERERSHTESQDVTHSHAESRKSRHTNTDTNTDIKNKELSLSDDKDQGDFYLTKKKRKLRGKRLDSFLKFWNAFNYKNGKAEAADSWYEIPELTNQLLEKIIQAAQREAQRRPDLLKDNKTPKMAQGWISGRRWEDEIDFEPEEESQYPDRTGYRYDPSQYE